LRENYGGERQYNFEDLQVHHAVSIAQRQDLKLCDENLITVCSHHHDMCERGKISVAEVKKIIVEQEKSCCNEKIMYVT
jgi:predicted restriction endonuclease